MGEIKKNIEDFHEHSASKFLINEHSFGSFRDQADLNSAVYHSKITLAFLKDMLLNIEGTNEQKDEFINKVIIDLDKFKIVNE